MEDGAVLYIELLVLSLCRITKNFLQKSSLALLAYLLSPLRRSMIVYVETATSILFLADFLEVSSITSIHLRIVGFFPRLLVPGFIFRLINTPPLL